MVEFLNPYALVVKTIAELLITNKASLIKEAPTAERVAAAYRIKDAIVPYAAILDCYQELKNADIDGLVDIPYEHVLHEY